ncbi:TetR family transcriptional regulator [Fodinicola feengrottensis]|uniref:TetR family transcriptional regulator n=1 Tax=Fodinicola feengrottensis TaxID=435914 RepID=A0ABP4TJT0_9ACTN
MTGRVRRTPEEAQRLILEAAELLLVEGGPRAVEVRAVAQRVGMTDAGVTHHFQNRESLLVALLSRGGRRLRGAVEAASSRWLNGVVSVSDLVETMAAVYADGYGELAIALHAAGWRPDGQGMLEPVVDALHGARRRTGSGSPRRIETRLAVAALHQALATDPTYGVAFRNSAGIANPAAQDPRAQRRWWAATIATVLGIPAAPSSRT